MRLLLVAIAILSLAAAAFGQYQIPQSVVGSGGGMTSGGSWEMLGTVGQPAIGIASNAAYTNEIGFWYQPGWILTGVPESGELVPSVFSLEQNQPNPFNPVTTLRFAVPEQSRVTIRLYNVTGREVRTIVNEDLDPGYHTRTLSCTGLPSGVYFCRMEAGRFSETIKLMLLK